MQRTIYACIVPCLLVIGISCNKETEVISSPVLQSSSAPLSQVADKHFIGEHFGGGVIFCLSPSGDHGLIAASQDFEEALPWSRKDTVTGAKDTALGAGAANTRRTVKVLGFPQYEADSYAALECMGVILNGYQDWYLPSINELNKMYQHKTIIGGFQQFAYWSSTESNVTKAWFKNFHDGLQLLQVKSAGYAVRPIRRF